MFKVTEFVEAVKTEGGASVSTIDGTSPTTGYIVSMGTDFSDVIPEAEFDTSSVSKFLWQYRWTLDKASHYLGAWRSDGLVYLDVVETFTDKMTAIRAGQKRNQIAIYDLTTGTEIATGGTGQK
jgi:hypothetical protein